MAEDEDRVFEAVRTRVVAGEYLDHIPGLPGVDTDGGGAFQRAPDGRLQRIHRRGDPGFRAARQAGRIPDLPKLTPASQEAVHACEAALGRRLPTLLRRCYLELGNGGFGPGYGLVPLDDATVALDGLLPRGGLLDTYHRQRQWPEAWKSMAGNLLLICHWGCGIASFIDLRDPAGPMWAVDPNPDPAGDLSIALFPQHMHLTAWLHRWVEGAPFQPAIIQDAGTGQWRPAVDTDWMPEA